MPTIAAGAANAAFEAAGGRIGRLPGRPAELKRA
jgi:CO/xanthine dehydrogenase Mo-binding subunit